MATENPATLRILRSFDCNSLMYLYVDVKCTVIANTSPSLLYCRSGGHDRSTMRCIGNCCLIFPTKSSTSSSSIGNTSEPNGLRAMRTFDGDHPSAPFPEVPDDERVDSDAISERSFCTL